MVSERRRYQIERLACFGISRSNAAQEHLSLLETTPRKVESSIWWGVQNNGVDTFDEVQNDSADTLLMRYKTTVQTLFGEIQNDSADSLWKTKKTSAIRLLGNFVDETTRVHHTNSCEHSSVNKIVPTHIMLLSSSKDAATFSPSVSKSGRLITNNNTFK